jgi:hypothetical protein
MHRRHVRGRLFAKLSANATIALTWKQAMPPKQLRQGLATRGIGFNGPFAQQQFSEPKCRYGSGPTDSVHPRHVGLSPDTDRNSDLPDGRFRHFRPKCAAAKNVYSITSSAMSRKSRLIDRPRAVAALRLMTNSNLVGVRWEVPPAWRLSGFCQLGRQRGASGRECSLRRP